MVSIRQDATAERIRNTALLERRDQMLAAVEVRAPRLDMLGPILNHPCQALQGSRVALQDQVDRTVGCEMGNITLASKGRVEDRAAEHRIVGSDRRAIVLGEKE